MERNEVRLELLKLTHHHGRDATEAVKRAQVLEGYVFGEQQEKTVSKNEKGADSQSKHQRKNAGNSILD
jgi:hypothetical protein